VFARSLRHVFIAAIGCVVAACADSGPSAPQPTEPALLQLVARPPSTIRSLVVEVTGPGIDTAVTLNLPVSDSGVARGTLTVSAGGGRRIRVMALDTSGVAAYRADTTVRLNPGNNPVLNLTLRAQGANAPVVVVFGSVVVAITSPAPTLVVGDTVSFSANVVRDGEGAVPIDSVQWATSDPGVLEMTGRRAKALRTGTVTLTASFNGFATTRVITVSAAPLAALWAWRNGTPAPSGVHASYAAHDQSRREILLATTDNRILVYRIGDNSWSELTVTGMPSPAGQYQIAFDAAADRILLHWRGLGAVYAIPRNGGAAVQQGSNANGSAHFDHVFGVNPVTNQAFTMAGYGGFQFKNTLWRFVASNTWTAQTQTAPWPWPRQSPTGAVASSQGALYLFGGQGNASGSQSDPLTMLHSLWKLDFASGVWASLIPDAQTAPASAPAGRGTALAATPTGSALFLYGPEVSPSGSSFQSVWRLRPGTDAAFAVMPTSGTAPTTAQTAMMFYDGVSQDVVLALRDAPLQVYRMRVQQ
jgi:hypothetical protein